MVTYVTVGNDRVMLTAYNPKSVVTMAKCVYLLLKIGTEMEHVPEEEFMAWLKAEAPAVAERLEQGCTPAEAVELTVDPRNAQEEARIVSFLVAEAKQQRGSRLPRPRLTLAQDREVQRCRH